MRKRCTKCHQVKAIDEFHKSSQSRDGHKSRCKACNITESITWQQNHRERYLARYSEWANQNRDKTRAASKRWNQRNRGVAHQRRLAAVGREELNRISREWSASNRKKARQWKLNWKKKNPAAVAQSSGKRRAAIVNAIPLWANSEIIAEIYEKCREMPNHHVDHIVPLVSKLVCGLHCEANLQIIPAADNYSKNNRRWPDMP